MSIATKKQDNELLSYTKEALQEAIDILSEDKASELAAILPKDLLEKVKAIYTTHFERVQIHGNVYANVVICLEEDWEHMFVGFQVDCPLYVKPKNNTDKIIDILAMSMDSVNGNLNFVNCEELFDEFLKTFHFFAIRVDSLKRELQAEVEKLDAEVVKIAKENDVCAGELWDEIYILISDL